VTTTEVIGLAVYHPTDLASKPELVRAICAKAEQMLNSGGLVYFSGLLRETGRSSRPKRLSEKAWQQITSEVGSRRYDSVTFDSLAAAEQRSTESYATLVISLDAALNPVAGDSEPVVLPYQLYVLVPHGRLASVETLSEMMLWLGSVLNAPYGFVYPGSSFRDALMEVTSTPIMGMEESLTSSGMMRERELQLRQRSRARVGDIVLGIHWGMLLGPSLLERLGGMPSVVGAAPVEIVKAHGTNIYFQVTAALEAIDSNGFSHRMQRLAAFIDPLLPRSPRVSRLG
jgi:hypothetical protein